MSKSPYASVKPSRNQTPQTSPIFGETQIKNNAGGYAYELTPFKMLERFLILGSEGGTYYVGEQKLTKDNALNVIKAIELDGQAAVDLIVQVSDSGRAHKNDPAIFALALAASANDAKTRSYALANLAKVCRIPTHLFHFVTYVKQFRGFGRGLKNAIGRWYNDRDLKGLSYSLVKYQSRDGWSNRDLLRLSHPKTLDPVRNFTYKWVVDGFDETINAFHKKHGPSFEFPDIIGAFELAKTAKSEKELIKLISDFNLSREMLPTEALNSPDVWEALLPKMKPTAILRNLGKMTNVGLLKPLSSASKTVIAKLTDSGLLEAERIHPVSILIALKVYNLGRGLKGSLTWSPVNNIKEALDDAFYLAFDYTAPTNQSYVVGVDVSGSMDAQINNLPMSAAEGAAAMTLALIKLERDYEIVCFDTSVNSRPKLTKNMSLADVEKQVIKSGGGTDCSVPMRWAKDNQIRTDNFLLLTDNETWAGRWGHPSEVMREYRSRLNPNAKIINVGMTATNITVNDPKDSLALDVAGFDASVPTIVSEFVKG